MYSNYIAVKNAKCNLFDSEKLKTSFAEMTVFYFIASELTIGENSVELSKSEIANSINSTINYVGKLLKRLEDKGLLEISNYENGIKGIRPMFMEIENTKNYSNHEATRKAKDVLFANGLQVSFGAAAIYWYLASELNVDSSSISLSRCELAEKMNISEKQVIRLLKELSDRGYVKVEGKHRKNSYRKITLIFNADSDNVYSIGTGRKLSESLKDLDLHKDDFNALIEQTRKLISLHGIKGKEKMESVARSLYLMFEIGLKFEEICKCCEIHKETAEMHYYCLTDFLNSNEWMQYHKKDSSENVEVAV